MDFLYSQIFRTNSTRLPDLPIATARATAVVVARNIYICGGVCRDVASARVVQMYDLDKAMWTKLPPAPQYNSEAAAINNQLVLIGGREASSHTITNMASTCTEQGWEQDLPAMPTKRFRPGVITYSSYVAVAGGMAEDRRTLLNSIDVLTTTTRQWWTLANLQLPRPMYQMKITACDDHVCVAGAAIAYDVTIGRGTPSKGVWCLPVCTLGKVLANRDLRSAEVWKEIAPTPKCRSAVLQHMAHPVAVGGHDESFRTTPNIAMYDHHSNKWSTVGQLLEPRSGCTVVGLSSCSFLVCGGASDAWDLQYTLLNSMEEVHLP